MFGFYGVVTVGVWLLGDKFGYDMSYRIVIIAIVLLTLPFALIGGYVASRRQKKAEEAAQKEAEVQAAEAGEAGAAPQKLGSPTGKYDELTTSTEEVVQFLKNSNLGAGKDAVYALPWFLVAGVPKAGKSSLVISSDLNFQNLPSQRQSELKFIRPTRSVDWRVTSDAVFVDTAGRYQTEGADQDEWAGLLDTIKKARRFRSI
jgi:type VI secretion system protein ImpL